MLEGSAGDSGDDSDDSDDDSAVDLFHDDLAHLSPDWTVRRKAVERLWRLEPAELANYVPNLVLVLDDPELPVRMMALMAIGKLKQPTLAWHVVVNAVVARLRDSEWDIRRMALETLGKLEPALLAQHASAVVMLLNDRNEYVRRMALCTLSKLERITFRKHVSAVLARLDAGAFERTDAKGALRRALPSFVTQGVDFDHNASLRSRLLGRLAWYRFRLRRLVKSLALYWYALQYRPSGPGHARDVEAWEQMRQLRLS